jgi:hypothetical protein
LIDRRNQGETRRVDFDRRFVKISRSAKNFPVSEHQHTPSRFDVHHRPHTSPFDAQSGSLEKGRRPRRPAGNLTRRPNVISLPARHCVQIKSVEVRLLGLGRGDDRTPSVLCTNAADARSFISLRCCALTNPRGRAQGGGEEKPTVPDRAGEAAPSAPLTVARRPSPGDQLVLSPVAR